MPISRPTRAGRETRRRCRRPAPASRGWMPGRRRTSRARPPRRSTALWRRSSCAIRGSRTHWARSLSGVHTSTRSTSPSSAATAAAAARASSASWATMAQTVTPRASSASSSSGNCDMQLGVDSRSGLVARPQIVSKRLDHVVGGDADVGGPVLEHRHHGSEHPADGADLLSRGVPARGHGEEVTEQLVGTVERWASIGDRPARAWATRRPAGARRRSRPRRRAGVRPPDPAGSPGSRAGREASRAPRG